MFWNRYHSLCLSRHQSANAVCILLGYSTATATKWKTGSIPNGETLIKIADYFDVSVDYLLGRTDKPEINR